VPSISTLSAVALEGIAVSITPILSMPKSDCIILLVAETAWSNTFVGFWEIGLFKPFSAVVP